MSERRVRTAVVEDDPLLRTLVEAGLGEHPRIAVIGVFPSGDRFLEELPFLDADVVVMDINLPGTNGIECVRRAKPQRPAMQFLMSTVFENPAYIFDALCAGATGYLVKGAPVTDLAAAVLEINGGGSPMTPAIARLVVASLQGGASSTMQQALLTTKEREVLDGLAAGLMYKEIAVKLAVNISTIRTHVRSIYEKLQVHSRAEAVRRAFPAKR